MRNDFTAAVTDWIYDWIDEDISRVWENIEYTDLNTTKERWIEKFEKIAMDFILSCRLALIRILHKRMLAQKLSPDDPFVQHLYRIAQAESSDAVRNLTPEENQRFLNLLMEMAAMQDDSDPSHDCALILRAWNHRVTGYAKDALSREEILKLGHILGLTLEEIKWFLLRVLDIEDGFRYNRSGDTIEAYCFLTGSSWKRAQYLKQQYQERCQNIPKEPDTGSERTITRSIQDTLPGQIALWSRNDSVTRDTLFLDWLEERAPMLDAPSVTARRIYRNLTALAYDMTTNLGTELSDDYLNRALQSVLKMEEESAAVRHQMFCNGVISKAKCRVIASKLLKENKNYINEQPAEAADSRRQTTRPEEPPIPETDRTKFWRMLTLRGTNDFSSDAGLVNNHRDRMILLLLGDTSDDETKKRKTAPPPAAEVEKGDILYLIWYLCNLVWTDPMPENQVISRRVDQFLWLCQETLDAALLPEFYPPHLTERTMLMSIVYGCKQGIFANRVYMSILSSLKARRVRASAKGYIT